MIIDYNCCIALGPGFRGGSTGTDLRITFICCDSNGLRLNYGGHNVMIYVTALNSKEILTQAKVIDNIDGTYTCEYRSPEKRGNYELHIMIEKKLSCGSPCPIFFNSDISDATPIPEELGFIAPSYHTQQSIEQNQRSKDISEFELSQRTKAAVKTAIAHLHNSSGKKPDMQLEYNVQAALHLAQAQSTCVKAIGISPLVTIDKLRELFCFYGKIESLEFGEESGVCHALIKFSTASEAEKSLEASGIQVGGRDLRVEKWVDHSVAQNLQINVLATNLQTYHKNILPTTELSTSNLDSSLHRINVDDWKKNWKNKQIQQYNMMEQYAALVAASKYKGIDPNRLLAE